MFFSRNKRPAIDVAKLSSFIAEDVEIVGDVHFVNGMRIDGRVRGDVIGRAGDGQPLALQIGRAHV